MKKAYCIVVGSGDYSDRCERPVLVYTDVAEAQAMMEKLETISFAGRKEFDAARGLGEIEDTDKKYRTIYEGLGIDGIGCTDDWALCECNLVEREL